MTSLRLSYPWSERTGIVSEGLYSAALLRKGLALISENTRWSLIFKGTVDCRAESSDGGEKDEG